MTRRCSRARRPAAAPEFFPSQPDENRPPRATRRCLSKRWFFVLLLLAFVVWGFFRTYFGLFPTFQGITIVQNFHGPLLLSWFALLIV